MKIASPALAVFGVLAIAVPTLVTSANAEVIRKSETIHRGGFGHGCKTIRTVKQGPGGRRVVVRKVCG